MAQNLTSSFFPAPTGAKDTGAASGREASPGGNSGDANGGSWQSALGALARRARAAAALEQGPQVQELTAPLNSGAPGSAGDLEEGGGEPRWAAWARQAADHVRQQAAGAAEQAQKGLERARTVDWAEQVKSVQGNMARGLDSASASLQEKVERAKSMEWAEHAKGLQQNVSRSFEMVAASASSAGSALQEKGQAAQQVAREISGKGLQTLQESQVVQKAREGATVAAGAARGALTVAGERAQGLAAFTMSPTKLAQFIAVFFVGVLFVALSFNFLPILLLAPQKFSMLFTIGSVTILGSFATLSGPVALLSSLTQRAKLPFTVTYTTGLLGTLWATLIMRSFLFTAIFAVVQALSLLYFIASFLPGGRTALSLLWRAGSAGARTVIRA